MVYCGTFGTLKYVLKRFGVEYTFVDGSDISAYREAVKPNTKVYSYFMKDHPRLWMQLQQLQTL